MTDFTITVQLDLEQDARNYRSALNKNTHSSKRKEQVDQTTDIDLQKLQGMKSENAYPFLREYLENFWNKNKDIAQQKINKMQTDLNQYKNDIFTTMEILTKYPIYRNDFTIFLTSLNRGPYNYKLGYTWSNIHWNGFVSAFTHELLHFQTIHYYKEHIMSILHDEKKFEDLKESLTFLLNHEFSGMTDSGYPQHQQLRKQLEDYWLGQAENQRDFKKLIEYGCNILLKTNNEQI